MKFFHVIVGARWSLKPLLNREACSFLWGRLEQRFPGIGACALMPDHVHQCGLANSAEELQRGLSTELTVFTQRFYPGERIWQPVPMPEDIPNDLHLNRTLRYIHLNPCRDKLASDPLEWEWSTYRDAIGLTDRRWIDRSIYQRLWGAKDFAAKLHAYTSADPSVKVEGTDLPKRSRIEDIGATLESIEWAALQVTRASGTSRLRFTPARRLMLLMADRLAIPRMRLGDWTELTDRRIRKILEVPTSPAERSALEAMTWLLSARDRFIPKPRR